MNENEESEMIEKKRAEPLPLEPDGEHLDWDAYIEPPPPIRKGKIRVQIRYKGPAQPMPYPDPDVE